MTAEDLAVYLHKPVNTIYKMRAEGTGPPGYRVGKHPLFKQREVAEWLEDQRDEI